MKLSRAQPQRPNIPGQNVPPALLVRFLREHQSECVGYGVDAYSAACLKSSPYAVPCARPGGFPSSQFLEVVRIEGHAFSLEDVALACDMYLLQLCSGIDESSIGACAQLVFAPIDKSFVDDALLVPSGFRVTPLDPESVH
ncbi:Homeobox-leucine zipper family protein / lipid-binding START domain-containing protein [Trifolium repens]|nr:Homeobox-leucine zipper family protein / lipid-binding START domain-containing protein [Trifolium repens]